MKRIFSLLLTIALLASLLVVPAFAANETVTLPEGWRLTSDLDLNVPAGSTLTIDGNGFHIYEMGGKLTNSGGGTVIFANGAILYPAAGDTDAARITTEGIWDTKESNALMALRAGGYLVKIASTSGGTVTTDKLAAKAGDTVTLTATPDSGYQLGTLSVTDGSGQPVPVSNNAFTMPASAVTISAIFKEKPAAPTFSPAGGAYTSAQSVTISSTTSGATIYYTTDGSVPTANSTQYNEAITISSTTTLKAITVNGNTSSSVATATYTINTGGSSGSDNGSSGSGSNSSGSGNTTTETTTNPDSSTTTTVTNTTTGTVTETTKNPDGSQEVVETAKDGTVTTTTTDAGGNKTEVVEKPDGSSETTVTIQDGSTSTTKVDVDGKTETVVKLPASVVADASDKAEVVSLPMPEVTATSDSAAAPTVTVNLPAGTSAKVEIPVANVTPGTVAVLVAADGTEEVIKTTVATENGVAVTLEDGATVKIVDNSKNFADVPTAYWGANAVAFAASHELMSGTSSTQFSPDTAMNRAMLVTVLARLDGVDTSTGTNWYDAGRDWAMQAGISDGTNMDGTLTREQLATMLYRYAQSKGQGFTGAWAFRLDYPDADAVSEYAYEAMCWTTMHGIIGGMGDGTLQPQGPATRAEVATMLMRFISNVD